MFQAVVTALFTEFSGTQTEGQKQGDGAFSYALWSFAADKKAI